MTLFTILSVVFSLPSKTSLYFRHRPISKNLTNDITYTCVYNLILKAKVQLFRENEIPEHDNII